MSRTPYGAAKSAAIWASDQGLTVNEAAKQLGFSPRAIRSAANAIGITLRRERKPLGSVKELTLAGHEAGMTVPQIAESAGVSRYSVYSVLRRHGLTPYAASQGRLPR